MVEQNVGRVLVVGVDDPDRLVGILTRGDLLAAHARRLRETHSAGRHIRVRQALKRTFGRERDATR
jgi:CBS-domain-containing membrane protein